MFLVEDPQLSYFIFTHADPGDDGFRGEVQADVSFYDSEDCEWLEGAACPERVLGVSRSNPKEYRVFKYQTDCAKAGYRSLGMNFSVQQSYGEYVRSMTTRRVEAGSMRLALHRAWDKVGDEIVENGGIKKVTPSVKRRLMREYIDGEPGRNFVVSKFWHPLKDHEKVIHLLDAFPDDTEE